MWLVFVIAEYANYAEPGTEKSLWIFRGNPRISRISRFDTSNSQTETVKCSQTEAWDDVEVVLTWKWLRQSFRQS
jgi:hypothetical protein